MHRTPLSVRLIVAIILIVGSCGEGVRNEYQIDSGGSSSRCENTAWQGQLGQLRPHDLPRLRSFDVSKDRQQLTLSNGQQYDIATRQVGQINRVAASSQPDRLAFAASVSHVKHLVDVETVQQILQHLNHLPGPLHSDPDTVDGMPTYESFVDSPDLGDRATTKRLDVDPSSVQARTGWRAALQQILQPVLHDRITPLVRHLYPEVCNTTHASRDCTPCFSLIRNYRHGQRQSHETHHDGHAVATVVVSLSDFETEYRGGLYVATGYGQKEFLPLYRGDAAVHRSFLLHGVDVMDLLDEPEKTQRWSWILWYRDSAICQDFSHEWFADCAEQGDAVCQQLHATKVGNTPGLSREEVADQVLEWNRRAAEGGAGSAAVKMARAYLKLLPSNVSYNASEAMRYYEMALQSQEPDGYYGMASLILEQLSEQPKVDFTDSLHKVVNHLENAAYLGHAFAKFNLGMVHTFGYGVEQINTTLAAEWFVASGLPEGYYVAYFQASSVGDTERMGKYQRRAQILGMNEPWRKEARRHTGSGGAGGVDLNLPWPQLPDGRQPPIL